MVGDPNTKVYIIRQLIYQEVSLVTNTAEEYISISYYVN